ncbi:MAG: TonB-dependent receptor [Bacteroidales bacterium]|nr:TonB-dependent receptor [Bacteroidales bacterium]
MRTFLKKSILLVLMYLICSIHLIYGKQQKGSISGLILDESTNESLIGAYIRLKTDFSSGTVSDRDGRFTLTLDPGSYTLIISFIGMETDSFSFDIHTGEIIERTVILRPVVSELQEVEIRVGKFDKRIEDITVSLEVIKPRIIENKNTRNIETALDYTPGLNILDNEPQIRGGSGFTFGVGSKVAVLVDDMPMLSGEAGRPYWDMIPVENIEHIEVIKGASSVLSGTSALSGAIHIMTTTPKEKPLTRVNAYTGFYSSPKDKSQKWWNDYPYITGVSFLHQRKIKLLDVTIGANIDLDHGYLGAPKPGPYVVDTISDFSDKQMRSEKFRLNFGLRKNSRTIKGLNYGLNGNFMYFSSNMALAWLDDSAGFYRTYPGAIYLQDQFMFYIDPYINLYIGEGMRHSLKTRILYNNSEMTNNQSVNSTSLFGDYQFRRIYEFWQGFQLIGGITVEHTRVFADMYASSGSDVNKQLNVSVYTQVENTIMDVINTSLGGRGEYFRLNDSITVIKPILRFGANFRLTPGTYLRVSYGQGFRFPTITERYIKTTAGSFAVFNNPSLKPENSWNAEIGIKQGFRHRNFEGYLDLAGFVQDYTNTIEYLFGFWDSTYTFALAGFRFLNTGHSRISGIDLSVSGASRFARDYGLNVVLGYSYILPRTLEPDYVFARDYNPGPGGQTDFSYRSTSINPESRILKYRFLHTLKADVEFSWTHLWVGASIKYFSKIENLDKAIIDFEKATEATGGTLQPIRYIDYFNEHNNGNHVIDLRFGYEFAEKHRFSIIVNNLLNRTYSLRPLKAEEMRSVILQYLLKI